MSGVTATRHQIRTSRPIAAAAIKSSRTTAAMR
jgi:hypothetical protein